MKEMDPSGDSIKRFVVISFLFHFFLFSSLLYSWGSREKRLFYAPVYTVSLAGPEVLGPKEGSKGPKANITKKEVEKKVEVKKQPPKDIKKEIKTPKPIEKKRPEVEKKVVKKEIKVPVKKEKIKPSNIVQEANKEEEPEKASSRLEEVIREMKRKKALEELKERVMKRKASEAGTKSLSEDEHIFTRYGTGAPEGLLDLAFKEYYNTIWQRIHEAWVLPSDLLNEDLETIYARLALRIARDGKIEEVWMEKSSKNPLLDESALRAIKKVDSLPPLPEGLGEDYWEVGICFPRCPR